MPARLLDETALGVAYDAHQKVCDAMDRKNALYVAIAAYIAALHTPNWPSDDTR